MTVTEGVFSRMFLTWILLKLHNEQRILFVVYVSLLSIFVCCFFLFVDFACLLFIFVCCLYLFVVYFCSFALDSQAAGLEQRRETRQEQISIKGGYFRRRSRKSAEKCSFPEWKQEKGTVLLVQAEMTQTLTEECLTFTTSTQEHANLIADFFPYH